MKSKLKKIFSISFDDFLLAICFVIIIDTFWDYILPIKIPQGKFKVEKIIIKKKKIKVRLSYPYKMEFNSNDSIFFTVGDSIIIGVNKKY